MPDVFRSGTVVVHNVSAEEGREFANDVRKAIHSAVMPLLKKQAKAIQTSPKVVGVHACMGCALWIHDIYNSLLVSNGLDEKLAQEIADEMGNQIIAAMNEAMTRAQKSMTSNN